MKNKLVIVEKSGNHYRIVSEHKFKDEEDFVRVAKKHTVPLPPKDRFTLSDKKNKMLFFDIDNKQYITFHQTDLGLSTRFLDKLFNQFIIGQLVRAVRKASQEEDTDYSMIKKAIIYIVVFGVGWLVGKGGLN